MIWRNFSIIFSFFTELKQIHDDTLQETKNWFDGSAPNIKSGIIGHYGNLPVQETNFWTMPNGPTWSWWILNILPVDPALKVSNFFWKKIRYFICNIFLQIKLLSMTSLKKRLENIRRILRILEKANKPRNQQNNQNNSQQNCNNEQQNWNFFFLLILHIFLFFASKLFFFSSNYWFAQISNFI